MKLKNQINLSTIPLLTDRNIKEEIINNFLDKTLMSKPLEFYLLGKDSKNRFDSVTISIRVLVVKDNKNEYLNILKYHLYNLDGLISKSTSNLLSTVEGEVDKERKTSINTNLKKVKEIFSSKLRTRNISIDSIIGIFTEFKFD